MKKARNPMALMGLVCALLLAGQAYSATIVSSNLTDTSAGSDTVSGNNLLAAEFSTDSASTLNYVTLLLQQDSGGNAAVRLYSDNGGIPGTLLATLTSPVSYSASLTDTTFSANGIKLTAATDYWIVLSATTGAFDWSWTASSASSGAGFVGTTASYDGSYWYQSTVYPYQMTVAVDPVATPEPATVTISVLGFTLLFITKKNFMGTRE